MCAETPLTTAVLDGVLVITLNRPTKANARNQAMQSCLIAAVDGAAERNDIRAVVLTGAGQRAFCGGMDLAELQLSSAFGRARIESDFALYDAMERCSKPIISAVNGAAVGGGLDLVLASDLVVAERHAAFACPEAKLGLVPLFAMLRLPCAIGHQRATAMVLCCRTITAEEALSWGLVSEVVNTGASLGRALRLARELAELDSSVVRLAKLALKGAPEGIPRERAADLAIGLFETEALASTVWRLRSPGRL